MKLDATSALIAFVSHSRIFDAKNLQPQDNMIVVNARLGQPLAVKTEIALSSRWNPSYVGLWPLGNAALLVVTDPLSDATGTEYFDTFHQLRGCPTRPRSTLILLGRPNWKPAWSKDLPGIQFAGGVRLKSGVVWLAGNVDAACGSGTKMGVWEVTLDHEFKNIYLDADARESQGMGIQQLGDSSFILIGKGRRLADVATLDERDTTKMVARSTTLKVNSSTRETNDAILVGLDSTGHETSKETLRVGSDLSITGAVSAAGSVWLFGALGNEAALMELQPPQR
jgi:hypothetical protein